MPLKADDVRAALLKKGFQKNNSKDERYILYVRGKKTIVSTMISHGEKEIGDNLLAAMSRRQMFLSRSQLNDFVACPLTMDEYLKILRGQGKIASE